MTRVPEKRIPSRAVGPITWERVLLAAAGRSVAAWPRTFLIITLVYLSIGIAQLDGDVPHQFILKSDSLRNKC